MRIVTIKLKTVRICCSKNLAIETKWNYILKRFYYYKKTDREWLSEHRVRDGMTIHLHCLIERVMFKIHDYAYHKFYSKYLFYLPYDIILGLLCCYKMREIVYFWKERK